MERKEYFMDRKTSFCDNRTKHRKSSTFSLFIFCVFALSTPHLWTGKEYLRTDIRKEKSKTP